MAISPTAHTAISAAKFVGSIGINTTVAATNTSYGNFSQVEYALAYLGVKNVRDAYQDQDDAWRFRQLAAQLGVSFDFFIASGYYGMDWQIAQIEAAPAIVRYVEGANESDLTPQTYNGLTGLAATQAEQTALYAAIHGDTALNGNGRVTPVIQASFGLTSSFATAGNMSAISDYGNAHEYFSNGGQPSPYIPNYISLAQQVSAAQPVFATEAGYYTMPSGSGVDNLVQAKYDLNLLFDDWRAGVNMTYLYQLLDPSADPTNTNPLLHFGLFDSTGAPKLAATALHDLIALLDDPGGANAGGTLSYALTGLPTSGHDLLMAKSNGSFILALWNDVQLWNPATASEISNTPVSITLALAQAYKSITVYDPLTGVAPTATFTNVKSVSLKLLDHPILVKISTTAPPQLSVVQPTITQLAASGQSVSGLWSQVMANAQETVSTYVAGLTITSVTTTGTTGKVSLNAATHTLSYTAAAYNPFATTDSFGYTVSDGHGGVATGTFRVLVSPPPNTTYGMTTGGIYIAPSANWTLYSEAGGQTLIGAAAGGDTFFGAGDTTIGAYGPGNVITASLGNHTILTGSGGAKVTLADGNNNISGAGTGNTITSGNGNSIVYGTTGATSVTLGNGNQQIWLTGAGNTISVGIGTSQISAGSDGNETVTVAGGTGNQIIVGGTGDLVHVLGGSNAVSSTTGQSKFLFDSGTNVLSANGAGNTIIEGNGNDTIALTGSGNIINAGSGTDTISFLQSGNTIVLGTGAASIYDSGSNNTFVLAPVGAQMVQAYGGFATNGDIFDLRALLASTSWNGDPGLLPNFLSIATSGSDAILSVDRSGLPTGAVQAVLDLHGTAPLALSDFLAHAIA